MRNKCLLIAALTFTLAGCGSTYDNRVYVSAAELKQAAELCKGHGEVEGYVVAYHAPYQRQLRIESLICKDSATFTYPLTVGAHTPSLGDKP